MDCLGSLGRTVTVEIALRLRWERKLGEAIAAAPKNRGTKGAGRDDGTGGSLRYPPVNPDPTPTLEDLGVGKSLADRARKLAAIPQDEFEEILEEAKGGQPYQKSTGNNLLPVGPTLTDLQIDKMESSRWQTIAAIPEDEFEERIRQKRFNLRIK